MNWAWLPSRVGAMTTERAAEAATAAPWSRRTRCRHRSRPAATPAEVKTCARRRGRGRRVRRRCRGGGGRVRSRRPSGWWHGGRTAGRRRPGRTRRCRWTRCGRCARRPSGAGASTSGGAVRQAGKPGTTIVSASSAASRPLRSVDAVVVDATRGGRHRRRGAADAHLVGVVAAGQAGQAEDLARDGQVEADHAVEGQHGDDVRVSGHRRHLGRRGGRGGCGSSSGTAARAHAARTQGEPDGVLVVVDGGVHVEHRRSWSG